jgi:hypothetical protein
MGSRDADAVLQWDPVTAPSKSPAGVRSGSAAHLPPRAWGEPGSCMRMAAVGGPVTEHDRHGPHPQHHVSEIRVRDQASHN